MTFTTITCYFSGRLGAKAEGAKKRRRENYFHKPENNSGVIGSSCKYSAASIFVTTTKEIFRNYL